MKKRPRHFVRVCVFILPGADMANNRLGEDFRIAREIWGIDFEITRLKIEHPIFNNLTSKDFGCEGRGDTEIEQLLFQLKRSISPDHHTVAVIYTGTDTISGVTRACTKRRKVTNSSIHHPTFMNFIFISNTFAPDSFAHELGHVFYFSNHIDRQDADLNTPGIQPHVEGNPHNIMAPGHIRTYPTTATPDQINRAFQSNSPQIIFDREGNLVEDLPYFIPHPSFQEDSRRSFNHYGFPLYGQSWPGYS